MPEREEANVMDARETDSGRENGLRHCHCTLANSTPDVRGHLHRFASSSTSVNNAVPWRLTMLFIYSVCVYAGFERSWIANSSHFWVKS